jgi:putative hemolysin
VLHLKDLLGVPIESRVKVFVRGGYFVPETKIVKEALREMRDELKHMGIIADEYGRPIGILTFEDLVEEITGEILDEYDHAAGERLGFGIAISGNTPISVLNEQMETHIPRGAYGTVAGFILDRSGRMSRPGDVVEYGDLRFHVLEVKRRRIKTVRITKRKEGNEEKVDSGN